MLSGKEVAADCGVDAHTVARWARAGILEKQGDKWYSHEECEIARVVSRLPAAANVALRKRLAGVLRRQLKREERWDGLAIAWPGTDVAEARFINLDDLEVFAEVGVISVLPLTVLV